MADLTSIQQVAVFPVSPPVQTVTQPTFSPYPSMTQDLNTWRYGPYQTHMRYPVHEMHRKVPKPHTESPDYPSVVRAMQLKKEYEHRQQLARIQRARLPQLQRIRQSPSNICYPNICSSSVEANPIFHPFFQKFSPDVNKFNKVLRLDNPFNRY